MAEPVARRGVFATGDGASTGAFNRTDWALTLTVAVIWGSSFLWIAIGLDSLSPTAVAFSRLALGAAVLLAYPPARRSVPLDRWPTIAVVAVAGNAGPALLLAIAQQRVESSVAGMLNAATPLMVLLIGIILTRRSPGPKQVTGLIVGFVGVTAMAAPNVVGADAELFGVMLLVAAVVGYGISNNVVVPLQQTYGSTAIIARAQVIGAALLAPIGIPSIVGAEPTRESIVAIVILGVVGTGIARALNATLAGRTGAARGSITTYLVPVIAIGLGVIVRDETIQGVEILGTMLVLLGGYLASRTQRVTTGQ